jgi:ADP-heptose:LPS heptosyltransferase
VRTIGVLTASGIGDFLVTVPALEGLRKAYPRAQITILGDSWHPGLLQGRPGPWDRAVAVPREDGICRLADEPDAPIHTFLAEQRGRYDLVLQMHGGGKDSNPVVRALRPRWAVGACAPGSTPLDRCIPYVPGRPEVIRWLEVAELAGAEPVIGSCSLLPTVEVTSADVEEAAAAWPHPGPIVLIHVGARDARRCWSPANFASVGRHLRETLAATLLLVGSEHDRDSSAEVAGLIGEGAVDLTGHVSLGGILGLARRSLLFLGNDSGPRHVAAAAGAPTVGIFWVGNATAFGPLVGAANRALVSFTVACPVCGREQLNDRCEHDVSFVDGVTTDQVLHACEEALSAAGLPP